MLQLLFVCHANVARSAAAERLARAISPTGTQWRFTSAGTHALVGEPIDPTVAAAAREVGAPLDGPVSRQATADLVDGADLVLAFETDHRDWLLREAPAAAARIHTIRRAAARLATRPRRAEPLSHLALDDHRYGPADDFADPYGRGPEAARAAVADLRGLLEVLLPVLEHAAPPLRRTS